jgi:hypothetical protein
MAALPVMNASICVVLPIAFQTMQIIRYEPLVAPMNKIADS